MEVETRGCQCDPSDLFGLARPRALVEPLGMNLYDDTQGMHIASNTITGNEFVGAVTAISLG
jgi:hypothetical protein